MFRLRSITLPGGMLVLLFSLVDAQDAGVMNHTPTASTVIRTTRAILDAAGGAMSGLRHLRLRSTSLGSGFQTGISTGRLRLTSGFVQRPRVVPAVLPLIGDFNGDGRVDFDDFFLFAAAFGSKDTKFDLNRDGRVDFDDFFVFAAHFGEGK